MNKLLLLFFLFLSVHGYAQTDVLILEKKGANVKTFAAGTDITLETIYNQWFSGTIEALRNDTVFLNGIGFHYKEIAAIRAERTKLNYRTDGSLLVAAGGGVLLLGAVNGLYRKDQAKDWYTTTSFITAGSLLILGILILKSQYKTYTLGKKYTVEYLALSAGKK